MESVFQVDPGSVDEMMLTTYTAQHSSDIRSGPRASETAAVMRKNGVTVAQPIQLLPPDLRPCRCFLHVYLPKPTYLGQDEQPMAEFT
jgi:hypothetical protein